MLARIRKDLNLPASEKIETFIGKGCAKCNGTGFYGRTALHEILKVDDAFRDLIIHGASAQQLKEQAKKGDPGVFPLEPGTHDAHSKYRFCGQKRFHARPSG